MSKQSSASVTPNGGILAKSLEAMQEDFEALHSDLKEPIPFLDGRRLVSIGYDSTSITAGLQKNIATNTVVGLAYDYDEGESAFKASVKSLSDVYNTSPDGNDDGDDVDETLVEKAKHFGCFIATTICKNSQTISRTVARYALKNVDCDFLKTAFRDVLCTLCMHGFVGVAIGMDGASENRSWLHSVLTHTVKDLFDLGYCPVTWTIDPFLPSDIKIAFLHPCFDKKEHVFVVASPDMPHLVKKVVNAMEKSSLDHEKRNLKKDSQMINLKMVESVWRDMQTEGKLTMTRLTKDHFEKNPNSRMRSFLAFQVLSSRTSKLIQAWLKENIDPSKEEQYKPLGELILLVDKLVDVMNASNKNHDGVDRPEHLDMEHLLKVVRFFDAWRQENENDKNLGSFDFIPSYLYEDIVWLGLGTSFLAHRYCSESFGNVRLKIDFGSFGSDCCEYRFGNLKGRYSFKLTIDNANRGTFVADNVSSQAFNLKAAGNTSGKMKHEIPTAALRNRKKQKRK